MRWAPRNANSWLLLIPFELQPCSLSKVLHDASPGQNEMVLNTPCRESTAPAAKP